MSARHHERKAAALFFLILPPTCVSLDARNGVCEPLRPRARMHSLSARRLLLISAPSMLQGKTWGHAVAQCWTGWGKARSLAVVVVDFKT